MTLPRMCLAGTSYLVTQVVHNRLFLLTPSAVVNQVVLYCAFRAARATGVEIHWLSVQSNHIHAGVTDHGRELSRFMQRMDLMIARCLIQHYRGTHPHQHLDGLWARRSFSDVKLLTPESVMDEMVYSLTNCVKDGLVADYRKWPGVVSRPEDWAQELRYVERPAYYFEQKSAQWAAIPYQYTVPPMLRDHALGPLIDGIDSMIRDHQRTLSATHAASGRGFRGVKAVLKADPFDSPNAPRPKGRMNPTVAAGGDGAMLRIGIRLVRAFRDRYREAWAAYRAGQRDVVFPAGTLQMRLLHHARCDVIEVPWCAATLAPS